MEGVEPGQWAFWTPAACLRRHTCFKQGCSHVGHHRSHPRDVAQRVLPWWSPWCSQERPLNHRIHFWSHKLLFILTVCPIYIYVHSVPRSPKALPDIVWEPQRVHLCSITSTICIIKTKGLLQNKKVVEHRKERNDWLQPVFPLGENTHSLRFR